MNDALLGYLAVFVAGLCGGAVNAVAGGGTIITFPVLIWLGIPPLAANASSAVALWPGSLGAVWGFRGPLRQASPRWLFLVLPSLAGGLLGGVLLLETPPPLFSALAPWLVVGATLLLGITRRASAAPAPGFRPSRLRLGLAAAAILAISAYGGYFGAGLGLLLIVTLSLAGLEDLHELNAVKNLLALTGKSMAVGYFVLAALRDPGVVAWRVAAVMAVAAALGGGLGARVQQRIGQANTRRVIVMVGLGLGLSMLLRR